MDHAVLPLPYGSASLVKSNDCRYVSCLASKSAPRSTPASVELVSPYMSRLLGRRRQRREEHTTRRLVVVLSGVGGSLHVTVSEQARGQGRLDELRTCTDNREPLHARWFSLACRRSPQAVIWPCIFRTITSGTRSVISYELPGNLPRRRVAVCVRPVVAVMAGERFVRPDSTPLTIPLQS
jgi:hypothetical protein